MSYSTNASITTSTMEDNFKIKPQNTTNYQKLIKIYESKEKVDEKLIISNQPYLNILEGLRK